MPFKKIFEVDGQQFYYHNFQRPGYPLKDPVQVRIQFKNAEASSLGMPLPAGTVRVYQGDSKGRVQFIGEDHVEHTPKDENVDLHIGNAFDVVEERKQSFAAPEHFARDFGVPRVQLLRPLKLRQRALPFTAAAVN